MRPMSVQGHKRSCTGCARQVSYGPEPEVAAFSIGLYATQLFFRSLEDCLCQTMSRRQPTLFRLTSN